jgi:hypothetical protein
LCMCNNNNNRKIWWNIVQLVKYNSHSSNTSVIHSFISNQMINQSGYRTCHYNNSTYSTEWF